MNYCKFRKTYLVFMLILSVFFIAGCDGSKTGHWDGPIDTIAPAVTFTVPLNNATGVPIGNKVTATFTEAMDPATINTTTFILKQGGTVVNGDVTYDGVTAIFTPKVVLGFNTPYTATITTGALDLAGNALASNHDWLFMTGPAPDITAPTVTLTAPVNGAPAVLVNAKVTATFSEPMDPATLTNLTFTVKQGATTIPGTVTYSGVTAVFTPTNNFDNTTIYTARITTGAKDLALVGNGLANDYVWNFTTGAAPDTTAPTVTLTIPAEGATGVATNTTVAATFSEAMDPLTLTNQTFTLKQGATTIAGTVSYAGLTAVFMPTTILTGNTTYIARITTGAKDLALVGNGLASDYVWSFTTSPAPDTTRPTVTLTVPADTAIGIPTNTTVAATFSEPMAPLTITNQTFTLMDGATVIDGTVDYLGVTAVFTPLTALNANTLYTATISSTVTDLALVGNQLAGNQPPPLPAASDYVWIFTTGAAPDNTAPLVNITNPDDLDINVPINKSINATFSEAMKPATMTTANFMVEETVSGDPVLGTVSYDIENNIATFSPMTDLMPDTDYTATVSDQARDLADNSLAVPAIVPPDPTPNPWSFRTAAAVVPPVDLAINLRGIASFGIASRAGLTSTGITVINGDVALYPLAGCTDSTGNAGASQGCLVQTYSSPTGMTVNGSIYWAGDPFDNGGTANSVTNDLNIAWKEGFSKVDTLAGVLLGELGGPGPVGKIILPGVYNEANLGFQANSVATFDALNDANAIFIIKVGTVGGAGDFTDSGTLLLPTEIKLVNGAQARNIWFVVGRDITIGSGTTWKGNILAGRDVTVNNGSTVHGRVLGGAGGAGAVVLTGAASPSVTTITVPQ